MQYQYLGSLDTDISVLVSVRNSLLQRIWEMKAKFWGRFYYNSHSKNGTLGLCGINVKFCILPLAEEKDLG